MILSCFFVERQMYAKKSEYFNDLPEIVILMNEI